MKINNSVVIVCMLLLANVVVGQVGEYRYKRSIKDVKDIWHSIRLPQDVLNHTNVDNSDIRIVGYDQSGKEIKVPYLLTSLKDEVLIESKVANLFNTSRLDSVYVYVAETEEIGKINAIDLGIDKLNFDGRVKLEGKVGEDWFVILEDYRIFSFSKPSGSYAYTRLEIPLSDYKSYRISLSNIVEPTLNGVNVVRRSEKKGAYYTSNATIKHIEDNSKLNTSKYLIQLDYPSRIAEFIFDVEGDYDYYRKIELSSIVDSIQSKSGWKKLRNTFYKESLISTEGGKVSFNDVVANSIEMTVYNLDDQPLQFNSVIARTPQYNLVARFLDDCDYYLNYGNSGALPPQYDVLNFQDSIPESMTALKLGEVSIHESKEDVDDFFIPTSVLYAIMALIIAVIGWFTIRMLSTESEGGE